MNGLLIIRFIVEDREHDDGTATKGSFYARTCCKRTTMLGRFHFPDFIRSSLPHFLRTGLVYCATVVKFHVLFKSRGLGVGVEEQDGVWTHVKYDPMACTSCAIAPCSETTAF